MTCSCEKDYTLLGRGPVTPLLTGALLTCLEEGSKPPGCGEAQPLHSGKGEGELLPNTTLRGRSLTSRLGLWEWALGRGP